MRKLFYLLIIQFMFLQTSVFGQIFFTVELQEDNVTYLVKMRSESDFTGASANVISSQVSLTIPAGGFKVDSIKNVNGEWDDANSNLAPPESPEKDYLIFNMSGNITGQDFIAGEEHELFSFKNVGECTGTLDFLKEDDPYVEIARQEKFLSITNSIIIFGAGPVNAYAGSYGPIVNCLMSQGGNSSCEEIDSIVTTNPSQCGLVGGTITIHAQPENGIPLRYSIDDGATFQSDSIFTDLQSATRYVLVVSDEFGFCFKEHGNIELGPPADAIIISTTSTPDTCMMTNGTIQVEAIAILEGTILEYSLDENGPWEENDGLFTGLAPGAYTPRVRAKDAPCNDAIGEIVVAASCPDDGGEDGGDSGNSTGTGQEGCPFTYILSADNGVFTFSLLSDTTFTGPFAQVGNAQISLKVPTGSFEIANFQNLAGATFDPNGQTTAPQEAPDFDYFVFKLTSSTSNIEITKGVTVPLFSFENGAECSGNQIFQPTPGDPFYEPNSESVSISTSIAVVGMFEESFPCTSTNGIEISDCGDSDMGNGNTNMNLPTDTVYVSLPIEETNTVCIGDELNITNIGSVSLCNSPATVTTNLTDGSNCLDITTDDHFNQTETICIIHFDANDNTIADTTILVLCPQVSLGADIDLCAGETMTLSTVGGTGNFTWTTDGDISCTDCPTPEITPTTATQYIVTSVDGDQCIDADTLMVNIIAVPTITDITPTQPTDCQDNGQIAITAEDGEGTLQYSIDNGTTFQAEPLFENLGAGNFTVVVANADAACTTTAPEVVNLVVAGAPSIVDVNVTAPNACREEKGSIVLTATSDDNADILEYSVDGGVTWQTSNEFNDLDDGEYNLMVRIEGSDCDATFANNPVEISQMADLRFTDTPTDKIICSESDNTIRLEINESITEHTISGGPFSNENRDGNILTFDVDPAAEGSLYTVSITGESGCSIMEEFTLTPGEDTDQWTVDIETTPASCEDNDGAVSVTVNENNNGFTFCWEPNKATGPMREGLSSDSTYSLTITGASGCTLVYDNIQTGTTCEVPSCNIFNGLDTLNAFIVNDEVTLCLPIEGMDMREFEFYTNNERQDVTFGECMQTSVFYAYEVLFQTGAAPFTLTEWTVNDDTLRTLEFSTIEELVTEMNQFDFQANWVVNEDLKVIQGFSTANTYGKLNIQPTNATQVLELQLSTMSTMYQSITLQDTRGIKKYTIKDPLNDCEDDLFIKVQGLDDGIDTLNLFTIVNTPILNQCLNTDETGTTDLIIQVCNEPSAGILTGIDGETDECFGYLPNADFIGKDFFCLELCNDGICDTTMVQVTVNEEGLIFYTGFSPNNDGINDVFTIKNIESYPENTVLIYNRWGNRIFNKTNYTNDEGWNGTFEDGLSPDGVYFYVIKVTVNGTEEVHSGPVMLSR